VIRYADGDEDRRSWRLQAAGPGRWSGTATDVRGAATAETKGNALRLRYTFDRAGPGGLQMEHWFSRLPDGRISNQAVARKFGLPVGRIDETITPDPAAR
jgi:hypothetical protein